MDTPRPTTRLAPSPTGALHLGNVRTFVLNALLARRGGWRMLLRVEDLDSPRVKAGAAEGMIEELRWLGLLWEGTAVWQSQRREAYQAAWERLVWGRAVYPCTCSRRDARDSAGAPHGEEGMSAYPGTCRERWRDGGGFLYAPGEAAWRVRVDDRPIVVRDEFAGERTFDLRRTCGDFVVRARGGQAAYQLAVVVDDAEAGVDAIVRGDDLLESAARQIHLRRLLGIEPEVRYWHLPLVVGADGRRLAKRHGDTRLSHYRSAGATPQRILGLVGYWSGLLPRRQEAGWEELERLFELDKVPGTPVVFGKEDDAFLAG